ncbi:MAG: recombinase family protein, partial [Terriglobales bacterium]
MNAAATYARSSKDRSDISIATQQRELGELARARDLQVVREFADAVQSGSTDDRPAFRDL